MIAAFAIKHLPTGRLMPLARRGRGYSVWQPGEKLREDLFYTSIPRLFSDEKSARIVLTLWLKGEYRIEYGEFDGFTGFLSRKDIYTPVEGRNRRDMKIVPMRIEEGY